MLRGKAIMGFYMKFILLVIFEVLNSVPLGVVGLKILVVNNVTNVSTSPSSNETSANSTISTDISSTTPIPTTVTGPYFRCSPDWSNFKDETCYKVFEAEETYGTAGERCRSVGGNLVSITTTDIMNFISAIALLTSDESRGFWIGLDSQSDGTYSWTDGSSLTVSNWSPNMPLLYPGHSFKCAYIEGKKEVDPGKWSLSTCDAVGGYICERPLHSIFTTPYAQKGCNRNATAWQWGCYWVNETLQSFDEAYQACQRTGGKPIWFSNSAEFIYAKSLIGATGNVYWTGLQRKSKFGTYRWSDDSTLMLPLSDLHISSHLPLDVGRCGSLDPTGHNVRMKITNCTDKYPVICKHQRRGYEVPGVTAPRRKMCPHKGWTKWYPSRGTICVKKFSTARTWNDANQICQSYGASLFKITDSSYQSYLFGKMSRYSSFWIGLSSYEKAGELKWTDGTKLGTGYEDWTYSGKPKDNKKKICASMYNTWSYSDRGWKALSCSKRSMFYCVMKEEYSTRAPPTTPSPPALYECEGSPDGWFSRNGFCYFVSKITDRRDWHSARTYCQNNHGELVSIHSQEENDYVLNLIRKGTTSSYSTWIGFNSLGFSSSFTWTDSSAVNFIYWNANPGKFSESRCSSLSESHGEWYAKHCGAKYRYACKKIEGATSAMKVYTPSPITGHCPNDWKEFGNRCYKIFTYKRSWRSALDNCHALGPGHNLASINSEELQRFLFVYAGEYHEDLWIGLSDRMNEGTFYWADNYPLVYTNWQSGYPGYNGDCVVMRQGNYGGKWKDNSCYNSKAYLCESYKYPSISVAPEPFGKCKKHKMFTKYRRSCYRVIDNSKETWQDARARCIKYGGDLATFNDAYANYFVTGLISDKTKPFWIGLNNRMIISQFKWSSRFPVTYTSWNSSQYSYNAKKDSCVTMHKDGLWRIANCSDSRYYVCEINNEEIPQIENQVEGICRDDWLDVGTKSCYKVFQNELSWTSASFYCTKNGARLASFHSKAELLRVFNFLSFSIKKYSWIGLYKDYSGTYRWHDGSPTQFLNWESRRGYGECVLANKTSNRWFLKSCSYSYPFICMTDKNITALPGTKSAQESSGGLTSGQNAIIAVVIIIIICATVAAAYYFFKIRPRRQGMSDASHSFTFDNEMYNNNNL